MASIEKRGGSYRIRVSGYKQGKQYFTSTLYKPEPGMTEKQIKTELNRRAVLFEEQARRDDIAPNNMKFRDYAEIWLTEYAARNVKETTLERYKTLTRPIIAALGDIKLQRLTHRHISQFMISLARDGITRRTPNYKAVTDIRAALSGAGFTHRSFAAAAHVSKAAITHTIAGGAVKENTAKAISAALGLDDFHTAFTEVPAPPVMLSSNTQHHYYTTISTMLNTAVYWGYIPSNPAKRVRPPRAKKPRVKYLDEIGAARLMAALLDVGGSYDADTFRTAIYALLYTGMRRGELFGLMWDDFEEGKNVLQVRRTLSYTKSRGLYTDSAKTDESNRAIIIPPELSDMLRRHKTAQKAQRVYMGDAWRGAAAGEGFIFTRYNGLPVWPDLIREHFKKLIRANNLPDITLHSLRHTNATLQIMAGVPIRAVSDRLGHSKTSMTLDTYSHAIKSANEAAAAVISNILNPGGKSLG
jgi:integrase